MYQILEFAFYITPFSLSVLLNAYCSYSHLSHTVYIHMSNKLRCPVIYVNLLTTDVDECVTGNNCHPNATCTDTDGSYTCTCKEGNAGDGFTCEGMKNTNTHTPTNTYSSSRMNCRMAIE